MRRTLRGRRRVAIARKLLVVVWHVLTHCEADRFAVPEKLASSFFAHAYRVGIANLPDGMSAREYTRHCLDTLGIGQNLEYIPYGKKRYTMPPSKLALPKEHRDDVSKDEGLK